MTVEEIDKEIKLAEKKLKLIEARKAEAETRAIEAELKSKAESLGVVNWQEIIKTIGAIILGLGGVVAAITQYELAEVRAEKAELKIKAANMELEQKKSAISAADSELTLSEKKKKLAQAEAIEAEEAKRQSEIALSEYKAELEKLRSSVKEASPELVKDELVYIQFRGALTRSVVNELREKLGTVGFNAPGAERLSGEYRNIVKYFSPEDVSGARSLKTEAEKFFSDKACPLDIEMILVDSSVVLPPPLELWLHHSCK